MKASPRTWAHTRKKTDIIKHQQNLDWTRLDQPSLADKQLRWGYRVWSNPVRSRFVFCITSTNLDSRPGICLKIQNIYVTEPSLVFWSTIHINNLLFRIKSHSVSNSSVCSTSLTILLMPHPITCIKHLFKKNCYWFKKKTKIIEWLVLEPDDKAYF